MSLGFLGIGTGKLDVLLATLLYAAVNVSMNRHAGSGLASAHVFMTFALLKTAWLSLNQALNLFRSGFWDEYTEEKGPFSAIAR